MPRTSIEWVISPDGSQGHTVNPIRFRNLETGKIGHHCEKISAGCANCFASAMQKPYLSGLEFTAKNREKGEFFFDERVLDQVRSRRAPTTFFWCDMTDLFGDWVPREWVDRCLMVAASAVRHRHVFLTKRADRMAQYMLEFVHSGPLDGFITRNGAPYDEAIGPIFAPARWPLPNVILGVSCEDQAAADERIPYLLETPAACRMVSLEPLLGPIDLKPWLTSAEAKRAYGYILHEHHMNPATIPSHLRIRPALDWVIVGGESGPGARPMHPNWARSLRDQCTAAGVPYFFKQWGGVHKKAAGRLLDGRVWDEKPEVLNG